jgi:aspartyl-tRNA(Asn)/glutamyl-tRNA(Gln) amidotransferase subunit A
MTDFTQATATELSSLYQAGAASPVTVAEQVLAKIERTNPVINAFCFTDAKTTLAQARASAQRWQQNCPLSALDGVPVAVKDSILTQGWPTLHASLTVDADQPWTEDAPSVARLREAGAVFVGKTTMSEFGSSTDNSDSILYGTVRNPWNLDHSPGGSSGGSASAVCAKLVPIALGTDFIGSISVPSLCCGIVGMKPSTGKVPQYPVDALELSVVGPMARSVADIALVMNIITNPDMRDGTSLPYNYIDYTQIFSNSLYGKKVACITPQVNLEIIDYLKSQKAQVDFISLDPEVASKILNKLAESKLLRQWKDIPEQRRHLAGRDIQRRAILSHNPDDTHAQLVNRQRLITHMRKIMQGYDVLIGPAIDTNMLSSLSVFFSITKQPTITVPIGIDSNGMPQSVMIAGAMHDDLGVLQLAHAIEKQFPMPHPPLFYSKGSLCKNEILNNA